jgi:sugar lactone lactonase YvrE
MNAAQAQVAAQFSYAQNVILTGATDPNFLAPNGLALDANSNIYMAQQAGGPNGTGDVVLETLMPGGGYTSSIIPTVANLFFPTDVAVDASRSVYIANTFGGPSDLGNVLKETPNGNGGYTETMIGAAVAGPAGLALDASGNVYIANSEGGSSGTGNILLETLMPGGTYTESVIVSSGLAFPMGVAVDANGNLYVADTDNGAVHMYAPPAVAGGAYTQLNDVINGLSDPVSVKLDASFNVYIVDAVLNEVLKETPLPGGGYAQSIIGNGLLEPEGMTLDGNGNVYIADTENNRALKDETAGVNLGAVAVGTASAPQTLTFTFSAAGTIATPTVVTQGMPNLDFTDAGGGSCDTAGTSYTAGQTCTVNVAFTPTKAGTRYGAAMLQNTSGTVIATAYVFGTGQGPQVAFAPPAQLTIPAASLDQANGVAVDGNGNIYIANTGASTVLKETLSGGSYTQSTIGSGVNQPNGVAVDGSGNVYIANTGDPMTGTGNVLMETLQPNGSYTQSVFPATGLVNPYGIAVDAGGNVYIANTLAPSISSNPSLLGTVLKETLSGGAYTQSILPVAGLTEPTGVAVDSSGNVYIANSFGGNSQTGNMQLETLSVNGTYTQSTIPATGLNEPIGVAVDSSGNIYIANTFGGSTGAGNVLKETPSGGTYTQSTISATGLNAPTGVAVDGSGNVYIANFSGGSTGFGNVLEENFGNAPTLTFATPTNDGTTDTADGALPVQIENIGNMPLTGTYSIAANFMQTSGSGTPADCTSTFSVAANTACNISVQFAPVAPAVGAVSGSVMLTDNNLNATVAPATMQAIPLMGTALAAVSAPTITISPTTLAAAGTVGTAYSATLTASGGTMPYAFAITSGALPGGITLSTGGVLSGTPSASGTFTFTVTATDSSPAPGPYTGMATYMLTVNAAVSAPTITIAPTTVAAATVGTAYSATLTASGGTMPYAFAVASGALPGGITLSTGGVLSGTPTASGTFTFSVTATDSSPAPGPYTGMAMYTLTVNAATATTFSFTTMGTSTATVAAGAAATYSFSLAPPSGENYPGALSFAATGQPAGATVTFTPNTVAANAGATTVTMSVQTAAATAQNVRSLFGGGIALALLLLPFGMSRSVRKMLKGKMLIWLLLLAGTMAAISGCGSSNKSSTPSAQNYTLTVTATSGTVMQSQTVSLTVQ